MSAWWMYKNNSRGLSHQAASGEWRELFDGGTEDHWGRVEWVPDLALLRPGDRVLAYQTDRNELVGVAEVLGIRPFEGTRALWLRPTERVGVKVRPLKKSDPRIAAIPALQQGPVRTIYEMTARDAHLLLQAARDAQRPTSGRSRPGETYTEGEGRTTYAAVRNRALREAAKRAYGLRCYCCDFDFEEFYGPIAKGVAVVHHLEPFDVRQGARRTSVHEVRVVCDNCHHVLHLARPPMDIDELRDRVIATAEPRPRPRSGKPATRSPSR